MTDYKELVKALRCIDMMGSCPCDYSDLCKNFECITDQAAAAIEELQQIADHYEQTAKDYWKEACEYKAQLPKRGEWIETEEMEWGIYPFKKKTCSVCDCKIDHTFMLACMDYFDDRDTVFHYCPNCGAKMEVQDGKNET